MRFINVAFLVTMITFSSAGLTASPHSIDIKSPDSVESVKSFCSSSSTCELRSLLPVTLRTGSLAHCAAASLDNSKVDTGTPAGIYLFYEVKNGCRKQAHAWVKIGGKWHEAGLVRGAEGSSPASFISILYAGSAVVEPSVVMFCPIGGQPTDDQVCSTR